MIVLNNKSNLNKEEFINYQEELKSISSNQELVLCPTYLNISSYNLNNFILGAQNVSKDSSGAHTGEVSASDLASFDVKYSIVGHSERRNVETNEEINEKIKRLLEVGIIPILCVGETKEERDNNTYLEKIKEQVLSAIKDIDKEIIIVAYEPVWSIGTGLIPTNKDIEEVFNNVKELLPNNKILYGGSANLNNVNELKECGFIDGYLVGGMSLKPDELRQFLAILES